MNAAAAMHSPMDRLDQIIAGEVKANEPLSPKVSIRAGGAAHLYVRPRTVEALVTLLRVLEDEGAPLTILGGGNNTLVGDGGVPGVTLKLPSDLFPEEVQASEDGGGSITLGGGAAIVRLVNQMKQHGWTGAEALAGIPGTIGGAATMNAGTKNGECMASVEAVELATSQGTGWLSRAQLPYHYRHTELPARAVVTRVRFLLAPGDPAASQAAMTADLSYRKRTQPLSQPNFGSVFTNPPGHAAGALVDSVGLKGHRVGGAQISALHGNWIVNLGGATARDVTTLMELMQSRVLGERGVTLVPEVKKIGVFE